MFSPETEAFIEHEVQIRALNSDMKKAIHRLDSLEEKIDSRFTALEERLENKFNIMLGIVVTGVLLPVALHAFKLI